MQFLEPETRTSIMHLTLGHLFSLFVLVLLVPPSIAFSLCGNDEGRHICRNFRSKHFVCDIEQVQMGGKFKWHYPMTEHMKKYILDGHNFLRNYLASGTCKDGQGRVFPGASRMRNLIWDTELEYIAYEHAARCKMGHSKCHSTPRFSFGGQNLASIGRRRAMPIMSLVNMSIDGWFNEKRAVDATTCYQRNPENNEGIGHFTQMINDQVSRVACALTHCELPTDTPFGYYFTCQYDGTNIIGTPVYHIPKENAKVASECDHWDTVPDERYPNLCKNTGKIFPVDLKYYFYPP